MSIFSIIVSLPIYRYVRSGPNPLGNSPSATIQIGICTRLQEVKEPYLDGLTTFVLSLGLERKLEKNTVMEDDGRYSNRPIHLQV